MPNIFFLSFFPNAKMYFCTLKLKENILTEKHGCSTKFFVKNEACDLVVGMASNLLASHAHG